MRRWSHALEREGWLLAAVLAGALGCSSTNVGNDASADAGPISDPIAFCKTARSVICDRAYACVPVAARDVDFMASYGGSVADCKSKIDADCVDPATNCPQYDPAGAGTCVSELTNDGCADLLSTNQIVAPEICSAACGL